MKPAIFKQRNVLHNYTEYSRCIVFDIKERLGHTIYTRKKQKKNMRKFI